jgi:hypothetical protein
MVRLDSFLEGMGGFQYLSVTPCFPQIVNITELAKDYGKNS